MRLAKLRTIEWLLRSHPLAAGEVRGRNGKLRLVRGREAVLLNEGDGSDATFVVDLSFAFLSVRTCTHSSRERNASHLVIILIFVVVYAVAFG